MSRMIAQSTGRIVRELYGIIYLSRVGGKCEFVKEEQMSITVPVDYLRFFIPWLFVLFGKKHSAKQ